MSFEIVLRREAQIDLDEIFIWYEEQKHALGFEFLQELENAIYKISHNPYYASNIEADARGTSLKKFPYQVILQNRRNKKASTYYSSNSPAKKSGMV